MRKGQPVGSSEGATNNLKKMRLQKGITQRELAEETGIRLKAIQKYERNENNINNANYQILKTISETLGCKIEDILN